MNTKKIVLMLAMIFCAIAFTACGDDDDNNDTGSGITGTYATPSEYDKLVKQNFRWFIVISKNMVTYYKSAGVNNSNYWAGGIAVPGASGWYVERGSECTASYVEYDGKLVLENGDIYVIQGSDLVRKGLRYSKYK